MIKRIIHGIVFIVLLLTSTVTTAQVSISVNLGSQPIWGPVGYDVARYYYLPDIETYYNVSQRMFYYNDNGRWISTYSLPARYNNYDLYNSYKVVINEKSPWKRHNTYRDKYVFYKNRHDQQLIRDSRDVRYFKNKNHPQHNNWVKEQKVQKHKNNSGNNNSNRNNGKNNKHKGKK